MSLEAPFETNMKTAKSILAISLAIATSSAFAIQSPAQVKVTLQSIYAKMDNLASKKDIKGLRLLLSQVSTSDCSFISKPDGSGKTQAKTREDAMQSMEGVMPFIAVVNESSSKIDHVVVKKGVAVATVNSVVAMTTKSDKTNPAHKIVQKSKSEDTWVKVGSTWKLKISKTITETATQDGKSIPTG